MSDAFGWVDALSAEERAAFAAEIERLTELGEYGLLLEAVQSWQGTAEAYLAGMVPPAADEWLADPPLVERPVS